MVDKDIILLDVTVVLDNVMSDSLLEIDPVVSVVGSIVVLDNAISVLEINPVVGSRSGVVLHGWAVMISFCVHTVTCIDAVMTPL